MSRVLFILWLSAVSLIAQTGRGNITGQVKDPSGAGIAGAQITVTRMATNVEIKSTTSWAGDHNVPIPPGTYRVMVTAPGFKHYEHLNVNVATASTVRLDFTLDIGTVNESVRVTTEVNQIQTETAKVSTAVQNRLVDELPLVVGGALRSPFDLVTVAPESHGSGQTLALGGGQAAAEHHNRRAFGGNESRRRYSGDRLQHAVGGSDYGVHRGHERLQGGVWPGGWRGDGVHFEIGHQ